MIKFSTETNPNSIHWHKWLNWDLAHPHIHIVDMPYRQASTWQDHGCEIGVWENGGETLAWAVFLPPWWNLDYAIHPSERGSDLEKDIFAWGRAQMLNYARRTGEAFYGSVEFFENTPEAERTAENLTSLGFEKFDWSTVRFELDLQQTLLPPELPDGYSIRTLGGKCEVDDYIKIHRAAFGSDKMTRVWRTRTLEHPAYRPDINLVIVNPEGKLVGFCICWIWRDIGQLEPLGVHPDYQGQGLGHALELSAIQILQDLDVKSVHLDHVSLNKKAIALSLKTGFQQRNNALRYFIDTNLS